jgi:hypothetical protein
MKIFISWSGELSHRVALILRDWLPSVIQAIEPYVSSEDIDKGARWFTDIAGELENSSFGIVCLTRENLKAPWILFESGAISKSLDRSRVSPLLINLSPSDLEGPLVQFQATTISRPDMLKLVKSINGALTEGRLNEIQVEKFFEKWWPDFEQRVQEAIAQVKQTDESQDRRSDRQILEEVLQLARTVAQSITNVTRTESQPPKVFLIEGKGGTGKSKFLHDLLYSAWLDETIKPGERWEPYLKGKEERTPESSSERSGNASEPSDGKEE